MNKAVCLMAVLPAVTCFAETPTALAIRDARVVTVSGPTLGKATVVMRSGLIESVGENVTIPGDTWVIDGSGLTVYPGLIDALSTWGLPEPPAPAPPPPRPSPAPARPGQPSPPPEAPRGAMGPEDRPSNTSWVRAADIFLANDRRLEQARNAGFTTAVSFPTRGIFAGQGAVVNLAGARAGEMVVASPAGLYLSMSTAGGIGFPGSSMGVIAYIRQIYIDAAHYRAAKEMYARNPSGTQRPRYDRALEGVLEAPLVLVPVSSLVEIDRMLRFSSELKTKTVLYGGHEAYRAADLLAKSGMPLLVSLKWPEKGRDADPNEPETLRVLELRDRAPSTPGVLAKSGVRFAFYSDGIQNPRDVVKAVKRAVDAGLSQDAAVRAMTLAPAEIYGVADRLGTIEKGKIANLVVTRGDLFDDRTKVEYVFVDGVKFQPTPEPANQEETATR